MASGAHQQRLRFGDLPALLLQAQADERLLAVFFERHAEESGLAGERIDDRLAIGKRRNCLPDSFTELRRLAVLGHAKVLRQRQTARIMLDDRIKVLVEHSQKRVARSYVRRARRTRASSRRSHCCPPNPDSEKLEVIFEHAAERAARNKRKVSEQASDYITPRLVRANL